MRFIVITGISGAGKSLVAKHLEDAGFYCIDNLPPVLISKIAEILVQSYEKMDKVAFVIDIRGGELLNEFFPGLEALRQAGHSYEILFLEASDEVVVKRYKESRRAHPLAQEGRLMKGISEERDVLQKIKEKANYIIDTSNLSPKQLKEEISGILAADDGFQGMIVNVLSFGFKYGVPLECDLVFDVRFLPNPYYIEGMKKLTGEDQIVKDYVLGMSETTEFISKLMDMLDFLLPNYLREGKSQLVIGIGCTGGRHRSVAIAKELHKLLEERQYKTDLENRDINKDVKGAGR